MKQQIGPHNYIDAVTVVPPLVNIKDTGVGNSKEWTVPDNEVWKFAHACCSFTTDATIGTRLLVLEVVDADSDIIKYIPAGATQTLSASVHYCLMQGVYRETSIVNGALHVPIAEDLYVLGGTTVKIRDSNNVSAGDTLSVAFQIERYLV